MSEIHEIKRRLSAVRQTRQITNAMYLISSSRMKRETRRADYAREYFGRVRATMKDILDKSSGIDHPYLKKRPGGRAAFLVIAGDKGLCGSYNSAVLKFALENIRSHQTQYIETVGQMATEFFMRRGMTPDAETLGIAQNPMLFNARHIVEILFSLYDNNEIDEIYIVGTHFINAADFRPYCTRLLPLSPEDYYDVGFEKIYSADMLYEPSPKAVFDNLVPQYAIGLVFAALVQSIACEHCARMNAMHSATDNADEIIGKLTRQYHTQRQLAITNEIIEVTAGAQGAEQYRNPKSKAPRP